MKATKALKRLAKIEALLSKLIKRSAGKGRVILKVFEDAKASVMRAKEAVSVRASSQNSGKTAARDARPKRQRLTAAASQKVALRVKKQTTVQTTSKPQNMCS